MCDCAQPFDGCAHQLGVCGDGGGGGGTVTSISAVAPLDITPNPTTATGIIQFPSWPNDAPGVLENNGAGVLTWAAHTGNFVSLQAATPGTPDTGNFNVSGTGIAGNLLVGGATPDDNRIGVNADGNTDSYGIEVNTVNGATGIQVSVTGNGMALNLASVSNFAITAGSSAATTAVFNSLDPANALPTVIIAQNATGTANLLEFRDGSNNTIGQFNPVGMKVGLGDFTSIGGVPDAMLHLFGGNTFTGNAGIIIQNDSRTDLSNVSKLSFADTNTATTLSNFCFVFETIAGVTGDLVGYGGGTDNDTPGTEMVRFPTGDGPTGLPPGLAGDAAVFTGAVTVNINGTFPGITINQAGSGYGINLQVADSSAVNADNASAGNPTILGFNAVADAPVFMVQGSAGPIVWETFSNGNQTMLGKLTIGSLTPGTNAVDVTGTVAATAFSGPLTGNVTGTASGNLTSPLSAPLDLGAQTLTNGGTATFAGSLTAGNHAGPATTVSANVNGTAGIMSVASNPGFPATPFLIQVPVPTTTHAEIMQVTSISGPGVTLHVTRGVAGSTNGAHVIGDTVTVLADTMLALRPLGAFATDPPETEAVNIFDYSGNRNLRMSTLGSIISGQSLYMQAPDGGGVGFLSANGTLQIVPGGTVADYAGGNGFSSAFFLDASGNAEIAGKLSVGDNSGTPGSHALDVTGDAAIVSGTTAGTVGLSVDASSGTNTGIEFASASGIGLQGGSATNISAYFQTSVTDGSNTNPTLVVSGNTAQTALLQAWRGDNGSTVVASMSPTGVMTASGYVTASQQAAFTASPYGTSAGQTGEMRFMELAANGSNYVGFKSPDLLAGNLIFKLPATDAAGPISSNGSGVLSAVAGADLTIVIPVANKTLTFTKGVLTSVV